MTKPQLHALIDMDGVVADWNGRFQHIARSDYSHINFPFLTENLNWDLMHGLDEEAQEAVISIMNLDGFYADLDMIPGADVALNEMVEEGIHVSICTSPSINNRTCASDKLFWLENNIGKGFAKRAVITSDKTLVMGDVLFDDKPEITGAYRPVWEHILFDQPYNRTDTLNRRRITDWANWRDYINV